MKYCLGLDLGSEVDNAAITILKRVEKFQAPDMTIPSHGVRNEQRKVVNELHMIYIKEIPLGTPYPDIVHKINTMMNNPEWVGQIHCVVDRTGVGIPVTQLMTNAKIPYVGVMITGGKQMNATKEHYNVPKVDIVTALLVAMQVKRFKMPRVSSVSKDMQKDMARFNEELGRFKMKVNNQTKKIAYEAETEKVHDDLVISTALAVWWMNMVYGDSPISDISQGGNTYPDYQKEENKILLQK